jgi:hypothetical protein
MDTQFFNVDPVKALEVLRSDIEHTAVVLGLKVAARALVTQLQATDPKNTDKYSIALDNLQ